jgi:hypothetical protein
MPDGMGQLEGNPVISILSKETICKVKKKKGKTIPVTDLGGI